MCRAMRAPYPPVCGPGFGVAESLPSTQAAFDRVLFDWSLWPIPDEARDLVQGRYISSHWLAPTPNFTVIAALLICGGGAWASAGVAWRGVWKWAHAPPGLKHPLAHDQVPPRSGSPPPTRCGARERD